MDFHGIGQQRKEEMFFNIIMPFLMVLLKDEKIYQFLKFIFENYPPIQDNRIIKSFKTKFPNTNITTIKEYMGIIFLNKISNQDDKKS